LQEVGESEENAKKVGGISLREILRSLSDQNPRDVRSAREIEILTDQVQEE
jgi:hypothetical protein